MPFGKGNNKNPKGRPKLSADYKHVKDLARQFTIEAVQTLVEIMRNGKVKSQIRVKAAETLLARGWGTPHQEVHVSGEIRKYVVRLPEKVKDADEWQTKYNPANPKIQ